MGQFKNIFATKWGIVGVGAFIGVFAALLQKWGNPGNMGICVACFERDISGALGLHRAAVVQYIRPEIIGFVLGSLIAAYIFREFRPRVGSAPIVRFVLGAFAMIGALVFLGCPWRALLRLAGGDGNAILGLAGLIFGIWIGTLFLKGGYNLGRTEKTYTSVGWLLPLIMLGFLVLRIMFPPAEGQAQSGVLFYSLKGPGAMHAPLAISLIIGLAIGFLAQRSRFCTMGALRDLILFRQTHLFMGFITLVVLAFLTNLILKQFHPGFANQPVAHTMHVWNFGGMVLAGLAFALAGGCPGRQLFLAGEGDGDAAVFVLGMIVGAGFAHNFGLASSPKGVGPHGVAAVIIGLLVCLFIGFTMRKKSA
ncbi:MAG: YedE-related selenium metabolism membrane protein [Deltaproteobacteria bacterium]|nr:YedE-related selenium metabolism membrane protein [Deltaproteobacteria bacterium]MBW1923373.1 YedE-related selenium metabolism membrane protein [Deltaproteobacteria bacterium]MBW1949487.1 YedE-related selenium metabolism membrane protein [Deltaproteobacteria bacterium]MBW2009072.1 YedE-related selenium metabolism membrane protein [Deltaproteobacteria bacterium]MBW2102716.1 YedE-related selenium metabolism membrane protein [Deltaproteobacteria bacterium]